MSRDDSGCVALHPGAPKRAKNLMVDFCGSSYCTCIGKVIQTFEGRNVDYEYVIPVRDGCQ